MPKPSLQAAGGAMPENAASLVHGVLSSMLAVNRRTVLSAVANAGAATVAAGGLSIAAVQSAAAGMSEASDIDISLSAYLAEARNLRRLEEAHSATSALLPDWARPGPSVMFYDGSKGGPTTGWPEKAVLPTPDPEQTSIRYSIRPSPRMVWERSTMMLGGRPTQIQAPDGSIQEIQPSSAALANRRRQRLAAFAAVRKVLARVREQREEKAKLGLPQLQAEMEASCACLCAMEDRLKHLTAGAVPSTLAVIALFEHFHEEDQFSLSLLRRVAPMLSGVVARIVDDMLARGEGSMRDTLLSGGGGFL